MILESAAVAPFMKNGFVVGCEQTREAVLIDPGDEVDELLSFVDREQLVVNAILLTHAHVDHVAGVGRAKAQLSLSAEARGAKVEVPIWLHRDDLFLYQRAVQHGALFGLRIDAPPPVDRFYEGNTAPGFGDYIVRVHHTPGHCPGGVCLQIGRRDRPLDDLFVGDTLFAGSVGRTDLPGGNYETLLRSITGVLLPLGDSAVVHPGHGPDTTIGQERRTNPFLLEWFARRPA